MANRKKANQKTVAATAQPILTKNKSKEIDIKEKLPVMPRISKARLSKILKDRCPSSNVQTRYKLRPRRGSVVEKKQPIDAAVQALQQNDKLCLVVLSKLDTSSIADVAPIAQKPSSYSEPSLNDIMFKVPAIPPIRKSNPKKPSARFIRKQLTKQENAQFQMVNDVIDLTSKNEKRLKIQTRRKSVCERKRAASDGQAMSATKKRRLTSPAPVVLSSNVHSVTSRKSEATRGLWNSKACFAANQSNNRPVQPANSNQQTSQYMSSWLSARSSSNNLIKTPASTSSVKSTETLKHHTLMRCLPINPAQLNINPSDDKAKSNIIRSHTPTPAQVNFLKYLMKKGNVSLKTKDHNHLKTHDPLQKSVNNCYGPTVTHSVNRNSASFQPAIQAPELSEISHPNRNFSQQPYVQKMMLQNRPRSPLLMTHSENTPIPVKLWASNIQATRPALVETITPSATDSSSDYITSRTEYSVFAPPKRSDLHYRRPDQKPKTTTAHRKRKPYEPSPNRIMTRRQTMILNQSIAVDENQTVTTDKTRKNTQVRRVMRRRETTVTEQNDHTDEITTSVTTEVRFERFYQEKIEKLQPEQSIKIRFPIAVATQKKPDNGSTTAVMMRPLNVNGILFHEPMLRQHNNVLVKQELKRPILLVLNRKSDTTRTVQTETSMESFTEYQEIKPKPEPVQLKQEVIVKPDTCPSTVTVPTVYHVPPRITVSTITCPVPSVLEHTQKSSAANQRPLKASIQSFKKFKETKPEPVKVKQEVIVKPDTCPSTVTVPTVYHVPPRITVSTITCPVPSVLENTQKSSAANQRSLKASIQSFKKFKETKTEPVQVKQEVIVKPDPCPSTVTFLTVYHVSPKNTVSTITCPATSVLNHSQKPTAADQRPLKTSIQSFKENPKIKSEPKQMLNKKEVTVKPDPCSSAFTFPTVQTVSTRPSTTVAQRPTIVPPTNDSSIAEQTRFPTPNTVAVNRPERRPSVKQKPLPSMKRSIVDEVVSKKKNSATPHIAQGTLKTKNTAMAKQPVQSKSNITHMDQQSKPAKTIEIKQCRCQHRNSCEQLTPMSSMDVAVTPSQTVVDFKEKSSIRQITGGMPSAVVLQQVFQKQTDKSPKKKSLQHLQNLAGKQKSSAESSDVASIITPPPTVNSCIKPSPTAKEVTVGAESAAVFALMKTPPKLPIDVVAKAVAASINAQLKLLTKGDLSSPQAVYSCKKTPPMSRNDSQGSSAEFAKLPINVVAQTVGDMSSPPAVYSCKKTPPISRNDTQGFCAESAAVASINEQLKLLPKGDMSAPPAVYSCKKTPPMSRNDSQGSSVESAVLASINAQLKLLTKGDMSSPPTVYLCKKTPQISRNDPQGSSAEFAKLPINVVAQTVGDMSSPPAVYSCKKTPPISRNDTQGFCAESAAVASINAQLKLLIKGDMSSPPAVYSCKKTSPISRNDTQESSAESAAVASINAQLKLLIKGDMSSPPAVYSCKKTPPMSRNDSQGSSVESAAVASINAQLKLLTKGDMSSPPAVYSCKKTPPMSRNDTQESSAESAAVASINAQLKLLPKGDMSAPPAVYSCKKTPPISRNDTQGFCAESAAVASINEQLKLLPKGDMSSLPAVYSCKKTPPMSRNDSQGSSVESAVLASINAQLKLLTKGDMSSPPTVYLCKKTPQISRNDPQGSSAEFAKLPINVVAQTVGDMSSPPAVYSCKKTLPISRNDTQGFCAESAAVASINAQLKLLIKGDMSSPPAVYSCKKTSPISRNDTQESSAESAAVASINAQLKLLPKGDMSSPPAVYSCKKTPPMSRNDSQGSSVESAAVASINAQLKLLSKGDMSSPPAVYSCKKTPPISRNDTQGSSAESAAVASINAQLKLLPKEDMSSPPAVVSCKKTPPMSRNDSQGSSAEFAKLPINVIAKTVGDMSSPPAVYSCKKTSPISRNDTQESSAESAAVASINAQLKLLPKGDMSAPSAVYSCKKTSPMSRNDLQTSSAESSAVFVLMKTPPKLPINVVAKTVGNMSSPPVVHSSMKMSPAAKNNTQASSAALSAEIFGQSDHQSVIMSPISRGKPTACDFGSNKTPPSIGVAKPMIDISSPSAMPTIINISVNKALQISKNSTEQPSVVVLDQSRNKDVNLTIVKKCTTEPSVSATIISTMKISPTSTIIVHKHSSVSSAVASDQSHRQQAIASPFAISLPMECSHISGAFAKKTSVMPNLTATKKIPPTLASNTDAQSMGNTSPTTQVTMVAATEQARGVLKKIPPKTKVSHQRNIDAIAVPTVGQAISSVSPINLSMNTKNINSLCSAGPKLRSLLLVKEPYLNATTTDADSFSEMIPQPVNVPNQLPTNTQNQVYDQSRQFPSTITANYEENINEKPPALAISLTQKEPSMVASQMGTPILTKSVQNLPPLFTSTIDNYMPPILTNVVTNLYNSSDQSCDFASAQPSELSPTKMEVLQMYLKYKENLHEKQGLPIQTLTTSSVISIDEYNKKKLIAVNQQIPSILATSLAKDDVYQSLSIQKVRTNQALKNQLNQVPRPGSSNIIKQTLPEQKPKAESSGHSAHNKSLLKKNRPAPKVNVTKEPDELVTVDLTYSPPITRQAAALAVKRQSGMKNWRNLEFQFQAQPASGERGSQRSVSPIIDVESFGTPTQRNANRSSDFGHNNFFRYDENLNDVDNLIQSPVVGDDWKCPPDNVLNIFKRHTPLNKNCLVEYVHLYGVDVTDQNVFDNVFEAKGLNAENGSDVSLPLLETEPFGSVPF